MDAEGFGFDTYLSPFTWRYGSREMRSLFSEVSSRAEWRRIWRILAEVQAEFGLVTKEELEDIASKSSAEHVDIKRAHEIERSIKHDLMAELKTFAEQAKLGGGKLHLGATSMDIEDNADALRIRKGLDILLTRLVNCLDSFVRRITEHKDLACMAWTHLQPAEPTTLGYRLSAYAQDLIMDIEFLEFLLKTVRGKGIRGAVGTSAGFERLLEEGGKGKSFEMEERIMDRLGMSAFPVSTQTYARKMDYLVLSALASIGQTCHKFGFDLRIMQSPVFGEWSEPIGELQVGSSAMPFKRNPTSAERMCSISRYLSVLPQVALLNASNTLLERTLDDSANRRVILPEAFLATDECLMLLDKLISGMRVYPAMISKNLERFGAFAVTEPLMMRLVEKGGDRQELHERMRRHSQKAWEEVMNGMPNPLTDTIWSDEEVRKKLSRKEFESLVDPSKHTGVAGERSEKFVKNVAGPILSRYRDRIGKQEKSEF